MLTNNILTHFCITTCADICFVIMLITTFMYLFSNTVTVICVLKRYHGKLTVSFFNISHLFSELLSVVLLSHSWLQDRTFLEGTLRQLL